MAPAPETEANTDPRVPLMAAASSVRTRGFESPWLIELRGHRVLVYERLAMRRRDPLGRDRLLCCGAVLANLHATIQAPRHRG